MSDGEYLGFPVAIKRLKMNEGDSEKIFKVPFINIAHYHRSALSLHSAVMSRNHRLETLVPSEYLAFVRDFYVPRPAFFPHSL